jgi:hypothetical protein
MADWVTISSLATAGGTLVLAVATFSSVKSANRSARTAERALLAGVKPLLVTSHEDDRPERVRFGEGHVVTVPGHGGAIQLANGNVYMAIALRNGGAGLAVIHGWRAQVRDRTDSVKPDLAEFRRQQRDIYIPAGDTGFWQGAIRDSTDPDYEMLCRAIDDGARVLVDILYGDHEGGQRTIGRFGISPWEGREGERAEAVRYWNVDLDDPRER